MPHLTYEYTQNLKDQDIQKLVDESAKVIINQGDIFPIGGIRVRAICVDEYAIADGAGRNQPLDDAFVHANLKVAQGRTTEQLQKVCNDLFELMSKHFSPVFEQRGIALSLEYSEFTHETWKKNNIHQRYKQ